MIQAQRNSNVQAATVPRAEANTGFAQDILQGLSNTEKRLDSKYFYNDKGSLLFQEIMNLPEYYLTRSEEEIFNNSKEIIYSEFTQGVGKIDIAELGTGDGKKTKILLKYLEHMKFNFSYSAIDISGKALQELKNSIGKDLPEIKVRLIENDYLRGLLQVERTPGARKILLFLGSNIGNFSHIQSRDFLKSIRQTLQPGDLLMVGFDLKKSPEIILRAYNDSKGVTAAFNLNLLQRINDELGGNFNLKAFIHIPVYDANKGEARSYLRSLYDQEVWIRQLATGFKFSEGELIHTEISRKYSLKEIDEMAAASGFNVLRPLFDSKKYFCDSVWKAC